MRKPVTMLAQSLATMRRGFCTSSNKEKIVASVLFERLPIVIPKVDPVVYAFQEFSFWWRQQYQWLYPDKILDKSEARGKGDYQFDYEPAPRIAKADKANDRRLIEMRKSVQTLARSLATTRRRFCTSNKDKIVASVLFERLPIVIPKVDPVVYAFQEFSSYGHDELMPALKDLISTVVDHYKVTTQDWFIHKKNNGDKGDPRAVFNVLDVMLKDTLGCLKTKRSYGHDELMPALKDLISTVVDHYKVTTQDWFVHKKNNGDKGDPQAVFNVLDVMLKDTLQRLKTKRESVSLAKISLTGCSLEAGYTRHIAIIQNLCLEGRLQSALWLRGKMIRKGVVPDILTHNYLINGLCKTGDMEKADFLIREMIEVGPSPNCVTYNTFIKGYCLINKMDKALYLFSAMANSGIRPNRVTCNILVYALCKKDLVEDATKLLGEILDDDFVKESSDLITSTILIDSCFKNRDFHQGLCLWNELVQKGNHIDIVAYNVLIHGFCLRGDINIAYKYFCEMFKRGLVPDVFTYNTLISGLCKEGKFDEALYIYNGMSRMGVDPDRISYKMLIQGLCIHGDVVKANNFILHMLENSMVPDPLIWNVVIYSFGRTGDVSNAISVWDQMVAFGVLPNVFTYNALIYALVQRGNIVGALSLKKKMLLSGLVPDVVTYNLLIGAACNLGNIHFALQLHDEMLRRGYEPDMITYSELIKGHCIRGNLKEAEELFVTAQRSGLSVDHIPLQIVTKTYCKMD